jgi:hypothetical protein
MQRLPILCVLVFFATAVLAQKKAVTETGEDVFLYDDGTWKYAQEAADTPAEIPTNPKTFEKNPKSTFLVKSNNVKVGVWLDAKKWTFKKAVSNEDAEYEFQMKGSDLYGMMITEKIEIPLTTLRNIAVENGRAVAPDLRIVREEYRTVNGLKVLLLQMDGAMQGIKISYYGYYYSSPNGTVQFITYTSQSLLQEYIPECENFLNGFSKVD